MSETAISDVGDSHIRGSETAISYVGDVSDAEKK
jgi:hypothetical protein